MGPFFELSRGRFGTVWGVQVDKLELGGSRLGLELVVCLCLSAFVCVRVPMSVCVCVSASPCLNLWVVCVVGALCRRAPMSVCVRVSLPMSVGASGLAKVERRCFYALKARPIKARFPFLVQRRF